MHKFLPRFLGVAILFSITLFCISDLHAQQSTQAAFSPSPDAINLVEKTINSAQKNIYLAAYSFTSYKVADALIEAQKRGVQIEVVLDKGQRKRHYKAVEDMRTAGIPIRIDSRYAIMHDKYMIIDERTVETGSFNYTASAEHRNAENVIVIKNNKPLAQKYMDNWRRLWDESEVYKDL